MSSRKPLPSHSSAPQPDDDPPPTPPLEPALEDCCGSGCVPCIFDIYEQQREHYQAQLQAWTQRQAQRAAASARRK